MLPFCLLISGYGFFSLWSAYDFLDFIWLTLQWWFSRLLSYFCFRMNITYLLSVIVLNRIEELNLFLWILKRSYLYLGVLSDHVNYSLLTRDGYYLRHKKRITCVHPCWSGFVTLIIFFKSWVIIFFAIINARLHVIAKN